jgi:hypothetical protein
MTTLTGLSKMIQEDFYFTTSVQLLYIYIWLKSHLTSEAWASLSVIGEYIPSTRPPAVAYFPLIHPR